MYFMWVTPGQRGCVRPAYTTMTFDDGSFGPRHLFGAFTGLESCESLEFSSTSQSDWRTATQRGSQETITTEPRTTVSAQRCNPPNSGNSSQSVAVGFIV